MRNKLHILYTDKNGKFHSTYKVITFSEAEEWLKSIGAIHWEIGVNNLQEILL